MVESDDPQINLTNKRLLKFKTIKSSPGNSDNFSAKSER